MGTISTTSAIAKSLSVPEISSILVSASSVLFQWENFDTWYNEHECCCDFICISNKHLYLMSIWPQSDIKILLPVLEKSANLKLKFQSSTPSIVRPSPIVATNQNLHSYYIATTFIISISMATISTMSAIAKSPSVPEISAILVSALYYFNGRTLTHDKMNLKAYVISYA